MYLPREYMWFYGIINIIIIYILRYMKRIKKFCNLLLPDLYTLKGSLWLFYIIYIIIIYIWVHQKYFNFSQTFKGKLISFTHLKTISASNIIIIFLFWEFFTPALGDGFSLEFEWQQVSSSVQDSSQYPGWSQQCYSFQQVLFFCWLLLVLVAWPRLGDPFVS